MEEVKLPEGSPLAEKKLGELSLIRERGVMVVAAKRSTGELVFSPTADTVFHEGDVLIVVGEEEKLVNFSKVIGS
jgi:voltage-gated potassium channel